MIRNKNIIIVGGTGTLGTELIRQLSSFNNVTVYSRDELKQQQLKKQFADVRFVIGDIRDREALGTAFLDKDIVFHVAALKHIDVAQKNPLEAVKTNILGTMNVAHAAINNYVPRVVFSSTDKAVNPINIYGFTKAISERYLLNLNGQQKDTAFSIFRWGNVLGSRGSVVEIFAKSLMLDRSVHITDVNMTRFWILIKDAAAFMIDNFMEAPRDRAIYPKMKSSTIVALAEAIALAKGMNGFNIQSIGKQDGEKLHESIDEHENSLDAPRYSVQELQNMLGDI